METLEATVKLPGSFLTATKRKEEEFDEFIRRSLAAELYREIVSRECPQYVIQRHSSLFRESVDWNY